MGVEVGGLVERMVLKLDADTLKPQRYSSLHSARLRFVIMGDAKDKTRLQKRRAKRTGKGVGVHAVLDLIVRRNVSDERSYLSSTGIARNGGCGLLTAVGGTRTLCPEKVSLILLGKRLLYCYLHRRPSRDGRPVSLR